MRTIGEILVRTAFRLYEDDHEKLQNFLAKRIDAYLNDKSVDIGQNNLETIIIFVCEQFHANPNTIKSVLKSTEHVEARAVILFIMIDIMRWSKSAAGRYFSRDHSTVINSIMRYHEWYRFDRVFREKANFCVDYATRVLNHETDGNKD